MVDIDVDALLGSPVSGDEAVIDKDEDDQLARLQVNCSTMQETDELLKVIHKNTIMITVESEKVMSKMLRTTDPVRERIKDTIDRQV